MHRFDLKLHGSYIFTMGLPRDCHMVATQYLKLHESLSNRLLGSLG